MTLIELKAKIYDLQKEKEILKKEKENLKKQLKEKLFELSNDYFLSVELANAAALRDLADRYKETLERLTNTIELISALEEKLKLLEE